MDASKAFDVVDHQGMLNAIYEQGVHGRLWSIFDDMYTDVTSQVKWNGDMSRLLTETQGIRQGGLSSTTLFKSWANKLLNRYSIHPSAMKIGADSAGALMCADDLVIAGKSVHDTQVLINEAQLDAAEERYLFSSTKTKAIAPSIKVASQTPDANLCLNRKNLEVTQQETHLGIVRTRNLKNTPTIQNRISSARRTAYSLMGAGLHGLNGINPKTSKQLWDLYVTPTLLHGVESLVLHQADYTLLEDFYRASMKQYQHLPMSTANAAVYLLVGSIPVSGLLHKQQLNFFVNMARRTDSLEFSVLQRQLAVKDLDSKSWTVQIRRLLMQYELPSAYELLNAPPSKPKWKKLLKEAIDRYWERSLKAEMSEKQTLKYMNPAACVIGRVHPVWGSAKTDKLNVIKSMVCAKLLVGRYPLMGGSSRTRGADQTCPMCLQEPETISHFILRCPSLHKARNQHLQKLLSRLDRKDQPSEDDETIKTILDPSWVTDDKEELQELMSISRELCFALHHARSVHITGHSRYTQLRLNRCHKGEEKKPKTNSKLRTSCGSPRGDRREISDK